MRALGGIMTFRGLFPIWYQMTIPMGLDIARIRRAWLSTMLLFMSLPAAAAPAEDAWDALAGRGTVALMRHAVGTSIGVKAAGGIRTYEQAIAMAAAGATRLGASAGIAILRGAHE